MSVALLILKIIGIVLLVLLGLVLLLVFSVLCCPVYYRIRGSSDPELTVQMRLRWLFPLVAFGISYEGGKTGLWLRILGFPLLPGKEKHGKQAGPGRRKRKKRPTEADGRSGAIEEGPSEADERRGAVEEVLSEADEQRGAIEEGPEAGAGGEESSSGKTAPKTEQKKPFGIRSIFYKIRGFFLKVKSLPRMIKEKVAKLKEMASGILKELRDEANHRILRALLGELKSLLTHYLPRILKADVAFGMGDPALTGQVLGALSMFPVFLKPGVGIVPDFMAEKMFMTGSFDMKGRVRAVHMIASAFRLWRQPDVKQLIQRVKNRR